MVRADIEERTNELTRKPGELTFTETLRWAWRQLTSMRTALMLLLLLALAAVPGSVIPQSGVDSLKTSQWQAQHPDLTPIYEKLQLFSVYNSAWFSAIYILLMVSLVGCFIPRIAVYWRGMRRPPPPTPRHLDRLPDNATYTSEDPPEIVLERAAEVLRKRGYRVVSTNSTSKGVSTSSTNALGPNDAGSVSAERGYLREAGNLLFHVSVLIVLIGFALGGLFGYKGGVILLVGKDFGNNLTQYDEFVPGSLFNPDSMGDFSFTINDFDVEWVESGRAQGLARKFVSALTYRESPDEPERDYDLRVNHPLSIDGTEIFLIGHGYAPVITIRDGNGDIAYSGPTIFLPENQNFLSFGVVKAPAAEPQQIGLEGFFYPTYLLVDGDPVNVMGDDRNPTISMTLYTGDLGLDSGTPQSVYVLDKAKAQPVLKDDGTPFRVDLQVGQSIVLPDKMGTVSFDGVDKWNKIQISRTPGSRIALGGVILALIGLLMSLFIRPRRVWVRATTVNRDDDLDPPRPADGPGATIVELAGLDRSGNGDMPSELADVMAALAPRSDTALEEER